MEALQSVVMVAAVVLLVLAFCSGVKAVCRKILLKNKDRFREEDKINR